MNKVVNSMIKKLIGLYGYFSNFMELRFSKRNATSRCIGCRNFIDIYNYTKVSAKNLQKFTQEVNLESMRGRLWNTL